MTEQKRVAVYSRISTDEAHQPWSLGAQDERLEAYCQSQGWSIVASYTDQGSGATLERPQLKRAIADARAGRFDVLLVVRVDRLSRNVGQLAQLAELLEEAGVVLISATEPFDTSTPPGRMLFQMLGSFAEFERAMIVDRVRAGLERRARSGRWTSGRIPYGYRREKETKQLEPDPLTAPVVAEIFRLYAEEKLGTKTIAQRLNAVGERTQRTRRWTAHSVAFILRNPAYLGLVPHRQELYEGIHPALIDRPLFDSAQRLLSERGEAPRLRRGNGSDYLLSGLIRCKHCGSAYIGMSANGNGGRYEYYACQGRSRQGRSFCDNDHLPRRALEAAVTGQLLVLLAETELFEEAWTKAQDKREQAQASVSEELERVRALLARAEERRRRYFESFEDGTLDAALCQQRLSELENEQAELQGRETGLAADLDEESKTAFPVRALEQSRTELEHADEGDNPAKTKALLRLLIAEIAIFNREEIQPTYRLPLELEKGPVRAMAGKVEPTGLEPVTSRVPLWRSPN